MSTTDVASPELAPGQMVASKFRLERLVGEGGIGAVWRATNTTTKSSVALKFLKATNAEAGTRKRLIREARAAGAVQHPNVRAVFDAVEREDGSPVLVMEYLDGESLADRLERSGKLTLEETVTIAVQVASGVGTAHAAGVVHRDLKPQNIFLVRSSLEHVKVLDFGIAKWRAGEGDASETAQTASGAILGTPYYMSPEQVFGEKDIDHRTDVWSLGLVIYECLTGVLPTRAENVGQVLKIIVAKAIPSVSERIPDLPGDVVDLVTRMLTRAAERRPASLEEVVTVLERHTAIRVPKFAAPAERAEPPTSSERAAVTDAVDGAGQTVVSVEMPARRSSPLGRGIVAALVATALGAVGWFAVFGSQKPQPRSESPATAEVSERPSATVTAPARSAEAISAPAAATVTSSAPPALASSAPRTGPAATAAKRASASATTAPSAFSPSQRFE